jgi:hypothetical protein
MASLTFTGGVAIFQLSGIKKSGYKIERERCVWGNSLGSNKTFLPKSDTRLSSKKKNEKKGSIRAKIKAFVCAIGILRQHILMPFNLFSRLIIFGTFVVAIVVIVISVTL